MVQSNVKKFMNNCMSILRKGAESDDFGGVTAEWTKHGSDVPCRIYAGSSGVSLAYGISESGEDVRIDRKMICQKDADIREGDKVIEKNYGEEFFGVKVYPVAGKQAVDHIECLLTRIKI